MKKVFRYFTMMLAIGGATLTSCLDKEEIVNNQKEQYQDNWVKVFGNIDPDHDWSVAKQVNATFNLAGVVSGEHTARIYTEQPGHKRCKLLAELTLNGTGNVSFNIEKVSEEVFIRVTDADGKTAFDGYFTIEGNQLTADSRTIASRGLARDASYGTSLGSAQTKSLGTVYRSGTNEYNEFYNTGSDTGEQAVSLGDIKYFTEVQTPERVIYNFVDSIYPIVKRDGGVFEEQTDNRYKMDQGVEYVTSEPGEVALTLVYGATALYNSFGYYYWKGDNATSAPKIILINDARPHKLLKITNSKDTQWASTDTIGHSMTIDQDYLGNNNIPNYIWGTKYRLVYYGDDYSQQGTYTFPEDVHIGFFILTSYWNKSSNGSMAFGTPDDDASPLTGKSNYLQTLMYSIPDHNKAILEYQNYRTSIEKDQNGSNSVVTERGEVSAVTYQYQGRKYLGFEDGVDKDMNDLIFLVEANIEVEGADNAFVDRDEDYVPEVETNSWIIACEDLGSVGDYDFNDAVFSVSHVGGSNTLTVTPLAAGGTYPIEVLYSGTNIGGSEGKDFHKLIDSEASVSNELYKPINAYSRGTAGDPITIEGVPTDYDINNHGFTVKVTKNPNEGPITITAPKDKEVKAPQMLVLPGNWIWPIENKNIHSGYPQFDNWTNDQNAYKEWYKNPVQEDGWLVDKPSAGEDEPGQGGTGGSGSATTIVKTLPVYNGNSMIGNINVEGGEWNYYIQIPAGHNITNNGATITFTGANESGNNIEIKLNGQIAHTRTNVMTISDASQLSGKAFGLYFWMNADSFNKITRIDIDNTGNGNSGTEEPEEPSEDDITFTFTVDDVPQNALTLNTNDYSIAIPKTALTGTNGAKIEITSTQDIGGSFSSGSVYIDINDKIINLTGEQITQLSNDIKIYVHTNATSITAITITNDNTGGGTSTPTTVTIPITVNDTGQNALTATNGQFTIPLISYGLGDYGATITFNGNATILINEQSQTINDSWDYEVSSYSSLSVTITDGTIDSIVITNKEKPGGGGTGEGDSDLGISIEFTTEITTNGTTVKISKSQLSKITTNSELYFLDNNNEKIKVNHDIRTNIDNVVWTYNNQSNPYIITANNVEVINRSEVEYITMNFWVGTPTKIYLKIAE